MLSLLGHLAVAGAAYTRLAPEFVKSPTDHRPYLGLTLANGLRAVVVADATATQTSVALNVLTSPAMTGVTDLMAISRCYNATTDGSRHAPSGLAIDVARETVYRVEVPSHDLDEALAR